MTANSPAILTKFVRIAGEFGWELPRRPATLRGMAPLFRILQPLLWISSFWPSSCSRFWFFLRSPFFIPSVLPLFMFLRQFHHRTGSGVCSRHSGV